MSGEYTATVTRDLGRGPTELALDWETDRARAARNARGMARTMSAMMPGTFEARVAATHGYDANPGAWAYRGGKLVTA